MDYIQLLACLFIAGVSLLKKKQLVVWGLELMGRIYEIAAGAQICHPIKYLALLIVFFNNFLTTLSRITVASTRCTLQEFIDIFWADRLELLNS